MSKNQAARQTTGADPSTMGGKIVLITGGAQGIGRAIALGMAEAGAHVVVADRDTHLGSEVAAKCGGTFVATDVARRADVDGAVAEAVSQFGALHCLVNNAGVTAFVDFFSIDEDHWDRIHAVNVKGMYFAMRAAALHMRENGGGSIVNIASIAGKGYRHTSSVAYAASKGGVIGLTRAAAMQLAVYGIRVNAICPGIVRTALNADWLSDHPERVDEIPLGLPCEPDDIASLAVYLASEAARRVTGQSWNVDGGLVLD